MKGMDTIMIKTIILDIGNVLAHFRWEDYLDDSGYTEDMKERISRATVLSDRWNELDRGARKEKDIMAECVMAEPEAEKEIGQFFIDGGELVKEYDYSKDLVRGLKDNGYKVYILSNYAKFTFNYARENFEFFDYIDGMVISYEVKYIKPEPEIYQILIDKYNINPEEAVFLDDKKENLEGAKPFGMKTIMVQSYEQMIKDLTKLGVSL